MISSRIIFALENVSSCFPSRLAAWTFVQIWVFYLSDPLTLDAGVPLIKNKLRLGELLLPGWQLLVEPLKTSTSMQSQQMLSDHFCFD